MTEKAGDIHAKELWRVQARIAKYRRDAEKLERFLSNFLMYPDGPEGTVVYRKSVEKEKRKMAKLDTAKKDSFWLPNKYGEVGIVAIMENCEHWKERRKKEPKK